MSKKRARDANGEGPSVSFDELPRSSSSSSSSFSASAPTSAERDGAGGESNKTTTVNPEELAEDFLRLLQSSDSPLSDDQIKRHYGPTGLYTELPRAINLLLASNRISLMHDANQKIFYKPIRADKAAKIRDIVPGSEQMLVYQVCERAGNRGIWTRDIKIQTNIPQHSLTKILKDLEKKGHIKWVRPVASKSKKMYMLSDVEPAKELTGGPWYTDHDFDQDFVDVICQFIVNFVSSRVYCSFDDVRQRVKEGNIVTVDLSDEELEQVMQILVYDNRLQEVSVPMIRSFYGMNDGNSSIVRNFSTHYKASKPVPTYDNLTEVPCGRCPIAAHCAPGAVIAPESCTYLKDWLGLAPTRPLDEAW